MHVTSADRELLRGVAGHGLAGSTLELPNSLDDDGWGGLISESGVGGGASKTSEEEEKKEEEEIQRRVRSLENR